MRRLGNAVLLLLVVGGLSFFAFSVSADVSVIDQPDGIGVEQEGDGVLPVLDEPQETEVPPDSPAPEERTYGGFRLDYIIALAVLGGLTVLSMVLGRIAKKNRKRN